jgi:DNA-binding transcriptional regulator YiaG
MLDLMTEDDVSKRLNVSVASLRRWRLQKRGPPLQEGLCRTVNYFRSL